MGVFDPRAYWEERLERAKGLEGVGYVGLGHAFNTWMYRVRRHVFKRVVRSHVSLSREASVLDVGSGTGVYLRLWKELGALRISGCDITETAVARLGEELPDVDLFRMDISEGHTKLNGTYDAVSCMDVLFHVVEEDRFDRAIANLARALKPNGLLFISGNFPHRKTRSEEHFIIRGIERYETAIAAAGLQVLDRRPMFHLLNRPMDSDSRGLHRWWAFVERVCRASYKLGGLLGAAVYPLELLLVRSRKEGVSTEIMVCVRVHP